MGLQKLIVLALAATALAVPVTIEVPESDMVLMKRAECTGQSCDLAAVTGASGAPFPASKPKGGNAKGDKCIAGFSGTMFTGQSNPGRSLEEIMTPKKTIKRADCKPYTLLFARGTFETGTMGDLVGPALKTGLSSSMPGKWAFQGVDYKATMGGDYCLGLPGGAIMTADIAQVASDCPSTKIVTSGYSEGAMVVHNGIARSTAANKKKIAVSHRQIIYS
jgi:Cutinase